MTCKELGNLEFICETCDLKMECFFALLPFFMTNDSVILQNPKLRSCTRSKLPAGSGWLLHAKDCDDLPHCGPSIRANVSPLPEAPTLTHTLLTMQHKRWPREEKHNVLSSSSSNKCERRESISISIHLSQVCFQSTRTSQSSWRILSCKKKLNPGHNIVVNFSLHSTIN